MSLLCQIGMTLPRIFREVPGVTVRLMSDKELARLEVLRDLEGRVLTEPPCELVASSRRPRWAERGPQIGSATPDCARELTALLKASSRARPHAAMPARKTGLRP